MNRPAREFKMFFNRGIGRSPRDTADALVGGRLLTKDGRLLLQKDLTVSQKAGLRVELHFLLTAARGGCASLHLIGRLELDIFLCRLNLTLLEFHRPEDV